MLPSSHLFIASIGNPPPKYHTTLHSAGHILLRALSAYLSYPAFAKSRPLSGGLVSELPPSATTTTTNAVYTLWQSPTYMNISGPSLLRAYRKWLTQPTISTCNKRVTTLVLLHDELEAGLGNLKVRRGGSKDYSARGHRGVRSVLESFEGAGLVSPSSSSSAAATTNLVRVGIGIGRPDSREKGDVSDYVLREMTGRETEKVKGSVGPLMSLLEEERRRLS